jgi:hypothetical protein
VWSLHLGLAVAAEPLSVTLSGTATRVEPWCGGPPPPPHLAHGTARPAPDAAFVVRPGRENTAVAPVATFRTGADGRFQVQLPPGTWCVVPAAATERPTEAPPGFDLRCLQNTFSWCLAIVEAPLPGPLGVDLVEHLGCGGVPTCGPVEVGRP